MSFESDNKKKTPIKITQIHRNTVGWNSPPVGDTLFRHPPPSTRSADTVQGKLPARNTAAKNHHGSSRSATGVRYRARCSCTKKNSRKSGRRCAATQCQGTGRGRNKDNP